MQGIPPKNKEKRLLLYIANHSPQSEYECKQIISQTYVQFVFARARLPKT